MLQELDLYIPPYTPSDCLSTLVYKLNLPESVEERAGEILDKAKKKKLVEGRNPFGFSAAVIQLACSSVEFDMSQNEIAEAVTVSTVSIRSRRKELREKIDLE